MTINAWQEEILFAHISHAAHHYCSIRFVAVKNCVYQQNEEKMYNITKYFVVIPLFLRLWLNHIIHHNIPFLLFSSCLSPPQSKRIPNAIKKICLLLRSRRWPECLSIKPKDYSIMWSRCRSVRFEHLWARTPAKKNQPICWTCEWHKEINI